MSKRVEGPRWNGETITALRTELRLTSLDFAKAVGVSSKVLRSWEMDRTVPTLDGRIRMVRATERYDAAAARRLAQVLGVEFALPPVAKAQPTAALHAAPSAKATFDAAVIAWADAFDMAPRKVRAAFGQLVVQLRAANADLGALAKELVEEGAGEGRKAP